MNTPGFVAEASLNCDVSIVAYRLAGEVTSTQLVFPQLRMTCDPEIWWICELACERHGGGMTSDAGGTVSCNW